MDVLSNYTADVKSCEYARKTSQADMIPSLERLIIEIQNRR